MIKKYLNRHVIYNWIIAILAIWDILLIFMDFAGFVNINSPDSKWFWVNNLILVIFAIDYFIGLAKAKDKRHFVATHIFDLLAIIPVGLVFSGMQLAKLGDVGLYFRLLRLIRLAGLMGKLREIWHTNGILYILYFAMAFIMLGAVAISITEHVSLDTAFWWAVTTASTVGYGDISSRTLTPDSLIGKGVVLIMILVGVGVMGLVTSSLTAYLMRRDRKQVQEPLKPQSETDNLNLILDKLDKLEKQNQDLMKANQKMQLQIDALQDQPHHSDWKKFKSWLKERKEDK